MQYFFGFIFVFLKSPSKSLHYTPVLIVYSHLHSRLIHNLLWTHASLGLTSDSHTTLSMHVFDPLTIDELSTYTIPLDLLTQLDSTHCRFWPTHSWCSRLTSNSALTLSSRIPDPLTYLRSTFDSLSISWVSYWLIILFRLTLIQHSELKTNYRLTIHLRRWNFFSVVMRYLLISNVVYLRMCYSRT